MNCMGGDAQCVMGVHVRLSYRVSADTVGSAQKHHLASSQHLALPDLSLVAKLAFMLLIKIKPHIITNQMKKRGTLTFPPTVHGP